MNLSPPGFPDCWASDWGEDRFGLWQAFTYQGLRQAFRWLPPGSFMMGSPETEQGRYDDEDLHEVTLSIGFWLAETTVTQAFWQAVTGRNPSHFKGEKRPVETVSWDDVQDFIGRLNHLLPGLNARLPREAEWEYACRAGRQSPFNFDGELGLDRVNYRGIWKITDDEWDKDARQETAEVKSYPCNDWGIYEMHGNVWEWCKDPWREHLGMEAVRDPWQQSATATDTARVVRGGSWRYYGRNVRSATRPGFKPGYRGSGLGFRLALGHSGAGR